MWFTKKNSLEGEAKDYLKNMTNFQLLIFIITFGIEMELILERANPLRLAVKMWIHDFE